MMHKKYMRIWMMKKKQKFTKGDLFAENIFINATAISVCGYITLLGYYFRM